MKIIADQPELSETTGAHFWARLLHDHDINIDGKYKSRLEWNGYPLLYAPDPTVTEGIPSTVNMITDNMTDFCPFKCNWQEYSLSLIKMWNHEVRPDWTPAELDAECRKVFYSEYKSDRFQSNKNGSDVKRDCINQTNTNKEFIKLFPVTTAGNIVVVIGDAKRMFGSMRYPIRILDGTKSPPLLSRVNYKTHPHLIHWGTIETRILKGDNDRYVRPFEFKRGVAGVPHFILGRGTNIAWVNVDRIRKITRDEAFGNNPYS